MTDIKGKMKRYLHICMFIIICAVFCSALASCSNGGSEAAGDQEESPMAAEDDAKDTALSALSSRLASERSCVWVYRDFGVTENHFTQKAKMWGIDESLVHDMDENCTDDPFGGSSCIKCSQTTAEGDWGGWLFLNGYLPEGESVPLLNDGSTGGQGVDLSGASELTFAARGENGGETVEFFTAGFGYDGATAERTAEYPDSAKRLSAGTVVLDKEWKEYSIPLDGSDMSYIVCGFGYVLNADHGSGDNTFYIDEIRFTGDIRSAAAAPVMIRSYDTDNIYIQNAAFSYDNALALMAFISEDMRTEAEQLADAFVYAVRNDRSGNKRIRNAYASGDISAYPGWGSGARLPGWYDSGKSEWFEDRYQAGSNAGNTSYVALALLQYYNKYGGDEYLETAAALMDWVLDHCSDGGDGFTGGIDGWEEGTPPVIYELTYKSIEHNIDAYAAFSQLYGETGDSKYYDAAKSAERFVLSMYNDEDGLFMTGTQDGGVTPNRDVVVLDAQVWCAMAMGDSFDKYDAALKTVEKMKTAEGGYPFCLENSNGGWWAEGTAYTALMYRLRGDEDKYAEAMKALEGIQLENGLFPAATVDNLSTGMEIFDGSAWEYSQDPHIAPAAWYIMASNGFNPYTFADAETPGEE